MTEEDVSSEIIGVQSLNAIYSKFKRSHTEALKKNFFELANNACKNAATKCSTIWQAAKDLYSKARGQSDISEEEPEPEPKLVCEVFLVFTRATTSRTGLCSPSCCSDEARRSFMHWKALFRFSDGQILVYHAVQVSNGLTGRGERPSKHASGDDKLESVPLGVFEITPEAADKAFRSMNNDLDFHPVLNNCQTWLVELLERLGITLPEAVKTLAQQIHSRFSKGDQSKAFKFIAKAVKTAVRLPGCNYAPQQEKIKNA